MRCRMFGGDVALKAFRKALCHVTKSGEVWCEGARIFLDPCCRAFDLLNASKCLNYAVFFTPQYGDTFIEAIKLLMVSSERFLEFHACAYPCVLSFLLRSLPEIALFIKRASFFEPNYGFLWFRAQPFMQSPLKEVLYTSLLTISREIALNAALYYEAMRASRRTTQRKRAERAERAKAPSKLGVGASGAAIPGSALNPSGQPISAVPAVPAVPTSQTIPAVVEESFWELGQGAGSAESAEDRSRTASHRVISTGYKPSFLLQYVPSAEKLLFNLKLLYGARQMDL